MLHAELFDPGSLLHEGVGPGPAGGVRDELAAVHPAVELPGPAHLGPLPRGPGGAGGVRVHRAQPHPDPQRDRHGRRAGVSVRSLQAQFRHDLGQTPTAYVRNRRLERARADLADAAPGSGVTVTDVAARWGFTHFGRFAATYRARFGETPSHTLRSVAVRRGTVSPSRRGPTLLRCGDARAVDLQRHRPHRGRPRRRAGRAPGAAAGGPSAPGRARHAGLLLGDPDPGRTARRLRPRPGARAGRDRVPGLRGVDRAGPADPGAAAAATPATSSW